MVGERYGKLVVIEGGGSMIIKNGILTMRLLELKKKEQRNARMTIKVL